MELVQCKFRCLINFLNLNKNYSMYKYCLLLLVKLLCFQFVFGISLSDTVISQGDKSKCYLNYRSLIVPSSLIIYGAVGTYVDPFKKWNTNIRDYVLNNVDRKYTIDDQLRYIPIGAVYVLDIFGVKAKHKFVDRSIIIFTSYILTTTTVRSLKGTTCIMRPDSSLRTSFPSGHTSLAFAGAEFLWQEYKDKSIWYGIAGYSIASSVGILRVINNKHWLTDVIAGAGVGMLCTKTSYFLYERFKNKIQNRKYDLMIHPYIGKNNWAVGLSLSF